ncbi:hypothetical protein PAMP_005240 [Pampus punctatissimus]
MGSRSFSSFINNVLMMKSALIRQLWFNYKLCVNAFLQKLQTRHVIVTPHCSSSAAVMYHRLVPRAETSTVKHAASIQQPYAPDVEESASTTSVHGADSSRKLTVNAETRLMLKLEPLRLNLRTTRLTVCFYFQ